MKDFSNFTFRKREAVFRKAADRVVYQMSMAAKDVDSTMNNTTRSIIAAAFAMPITAPFSFSDYPQLEKKADVLLSGMSSSIMDTIKTRSISSASISAENNGFDGQFEQDVIDYIDRSDATEKTEKYNRLFKDQLELYIAYALTAGWSANKTAQEYITWRKHPYQATFLTADKDNGVSLARIKPGSGNYTSVSSNFIRMEQYLIFSAYNFTNRLLWRKDRNIIGYRTFRNSSYPCEICDSLLGKVHPLTEIAVPAHGHCVCGSYPVYRSDLKEK